MFRKYFLCQKLLLLLWTSSKGPSCMPVKVTVLIFQLNTSFAQQIRNIIYMALANKPVSVLYNYCRKVLSFLTAYAFFIQKIKWRACTVMCFFH